MDVRMMTNTGDTVFVHPDDVAKAQGIGWSIPRGAPAEATRGNVPVNAAMPQPNVPVIPQITDFLHRMLPATYSTGLGLLGLSAGPLGGGIGALAGQRLGQVLQGGPPQPPNPMDAMTFGAGAGGPLAERGAQLAAPALMEHSMRPTAGDLARYPGMVEAAIARGERVGAGGAAERAGAAKTAFSAERAAQAAVTRDQQKRLLGEADQVLAQRAGQERAAATAASKSLVRGSQDKFTLKDLAANHISVMRADKGGTLSHEEVIDGTLEVQDAIRNLGMRVKPAYSAAEVDRMRRLAGSKYRGVFQNPGARATGANDVDLNLATGARELLHQRVPNLQPARALESSKIALNQAARSGSSPALGRLARAGDVTAQEAVGMRQLAREGPRSRLVAQRSGPASPAEMEAILSRRLLSAAQNRLPWYEQYGAPLAVGGAEFAAGHNPLLAALAAAATRASVSPRVQSQTALTLANPMIQQLLRYGPLGANLIGRGVANAFTPPDTTGAAP